MVTSSSEEVTKYLENDVDAMSRVAHSSLTERSKSAWWDKKRKASQ